MAAAAAVRTAGAAASSSSRGSARGARGRGDFSSSSSSSSEDNEGVVGSAKSGELIGLRSIASTALGQSGVLRAVSWLLAHADGGVRATARQILEIIL